MAAKVSPKPSKNNAGRIGLVVLLLAVSGLGYWYWQSRTKPVYKDHATLEQMSSQIRSQMKDAMLSPTAKAWGGADLAFIESQMSSEDESVRTKFLQNSIYYLSQTETNGENEAARLKVLDLLTNFVDQNAETFRGPKARSVVLASRLIASLPAPTQNSPSYKKIVNLALSPKTPDPVGPLMLEAVLTWPKVPTEALGRVRTGALSKNAGQAMISLQMLPKVKDEQTRLNLYEEIRSSFEAIAPAAQPFTLKTLAQSTPPSSNKLDDLIAFAGKKINEPDASAWQDAYIFAIERTQRLPKEQVANLRTIASSNENPIVRERARMIETQLQKGEGK